MGLAVTRHAKRLFIIKERFTHVDSNYTNSLGSEESVYIRKEFNSHKIG